MRGSEDKGDKFLFFGDVELLSVLTLSLTKEMDGIRKGLFTSSSQTKIKCSGTPKSSPILKGK